MTSARKYAEINTSHYPVVVVTLSTIEPTVKEFQEHLDELSYIIKNHQNFVLILDLSKSKFVSSQQRIMAGTWLKQESGMMKKNMRGMVFLNQSMMMGMILKGVLLVAKPGVEYLVSGSREESMNWANQKLSNQTVRN